MLRSNALPVFSGFQKYCVPPYSLQPAAPCTCSMQTRRVRLAALPAAVWANAARAGTIESSRGSAIVAPSPRRAVRRDMCFPERTAIVTSPGDLGPTGMHVFSAAPGVPVRAVLLNNVGASLPFRSIHPCYRPEPRFPAFPAAAVPGFPLGAAWVDSASAVRNGALFTTPRINDDIL